MATPNPPNPNKKFQQGVVIGKFYPPHNGHLHVIQTAADQCQNLLVLVCDKPDQRPTGQERQAWLQELFPDLSVQIVLTPDDLPEAPEPWAVRVKDILRSTPDAVFTSEDYGAPFAESLQCQHVLVDLHRTAHPVSGTAIRENPLGNWNHLPPPVKEYYALRIVLVGAESSGKTTLAEQLAQHLNTEWVPEYGREHTELKYQGKLTQLGVGEGNQWNTQDFLTIAQTQTDRENRFARTCNGLLICDTNAWATGLWHERYLGHRSPKLDQLGKQAKAHLYLLCAPDLPFVQDGLRDGEQIRTWMHHRFLEKLTQAQLPYEIVVGRGQVRLNIALSLIKAHLPT